MILQSKYIKPVKDLLLVFGSDFIHQQFFATGSEGRCSPDNRSFVADNCHMFWRKGK